jgi:hypothetical protein
MNNKSAEADRFTGLNFVISHCYLVFSVILINFFLVYPALSIGPRAVIIEPLEGSYITSTPVNLRIKAAHPSGVIKDSLIVSVDGKIIKSGDWGSVVPAGVTAEVIEYTKDISSDFINREGRHQIQVIDVFSDIPGSEGLSNGPVVTNFTYDSIKPEVLRVIPASGVSIESLRPTIEVHFSEPVNTEKFIGDTTDPGFKVTASGQQISGNAQWSDKKDILYFLPHEDIPVDTSFESDVQILIKNFEDIAGNIQLSAWSSSFEISADKAAAPFITGTWPVNNQIDVDPASAFTLIFSKGIIKDTLLNKIRIINGSRTYIYPGQLESTNHPDPGVFSFKVNSSVTALQYNSLHTVVVDPGFKDGEGREQKQGFSFSFSTASPPSEEPLNLKLTDYRPLNNETLYTLRPSLSYRFDRPIDPSTVYVGFSLSEGAFDRAGKFEFSSDGKSFTFIPGQDLIPDKSYTWTLNSNIRDFDGIGFGGLADVSQTGSFRIGKTPFIIGSVPLEGFEGVDISEAIKIKFNTSMDPNTINPSNIRVFTEEDSVSLNRMELIGNDLLIEISESGKKDYMGKKFSVHVSKNIKSLYGMSLQDDFMLTFISTGDAIKPYVIEISPKPFEEELPLNYTVIVEFSEPMNIFSVENAFKIISENNSEFEYNKSKGTFQWSLDQKILRYTLNNGITYESGKKHSLIIDDSAQDMNGNSLDDVNDSGLGGENYQIEFTFRNEDLLNVVSTSPANDSIDVSKNSNIAIQFSRPVKESSLLSSVEIIDSGNKCISGLFSYTEDMETVIFNPDQELKSGTVTVRIKSGISGIRTEEGNFFDGNMDKIAGISPDDDYVFTFTVLSLPLLVSSEPVNGASQIRQDIKIPVRVKYDQAMDINTFTSQSVKVWLKESYYYDFQLTVDKFRLSDFDKIVNFEILLDGINGNFDEKSLKVQISTEVKDQRGLSPEKNSEFYFTVNNPDRPLVLMSGINPADKSKNVVKRPGVYIPFSEPMDRQSVEQAFSIKPVNEGQYIGKSGIFEWNVEFTAMTFTPSHDLIEGVTYEVNFDTSATDVSGAFIQAGFNYTFSVINTVPPSLVTTIPVDKTLDVAVDSRIILIFSQPMDISTLKNIVISSDREVSIDRIEADPLSNVRYVAVPESLSPNKPYTITIPRTVQDLRGNQLDQKYVVNFTTKGLGDTLEAAGFVIPGDPKHAVVLVQTNEAVDSSLNVTVRQKGMPAAVPMIMNTVKSPKNGIYLYKGIYEINRSSEFFGIAEVSVSARISGILNNKITTLVIKE